MMSKKNCLPLPIRFMITGIHFGCLHVTFMQSLRLKGFSKNQYYCKNLNISWELREARLCTSRVTCSIEVFTKRVGKKLIQRVLTLRAFWDFGKTVLHEICVSETVLWSLLTLIPPLTRT